MKKSSYNLITPVKNEANNILPLAKCVNNQTHTPNVWVIIDDGSTDNTPVILNDLSKKHEWIHIVKYTDEYKRGFGNHFAQVVSTGFKESLRISDNVKYLAKIDADVRFHNETFRDLIKKMDCSPDIGIISPRLFTLSKNIEVEKLKDPKKIFCKDFVVRSDKKRVDEPTDGIRVYRKKFLDEIGGFPITDASADIILAKAVMRGFKVGFTDDIWGYLVRETGSTLDNSYKRGKFSGYRLYIEHYHPLLLMARLFWDSLNNPVQFIGEFVGYFESFINQEKRINDPEVIEYYRKVRFKKMFESIAKV